MSSYSLWSTPQAVFDRQPYREHDEQLGDRLPELLDVVEYGADVFEVQITAYDELVDLSIAVENTVLEEEDFGVDNQAWSVLRRDAAYLDLSVKSLVPPSWPAWLPAALQELVS